MKRKDEVHLPSRKERRQLERKLVKAKRHAWHHGHQVSFRRDRSTRHSSSLDSDVDRNIENTSRSQTEEEKEKEEEKSN